MRKPEIDLEAAALALLSAIPPDIITDARGEELDEESIAEIQRMRAADWARAGHRNPDQVRAWIAAGVVNEHIAHLVCRV